MIELQFEEVRYFSDLDEDHFFSWLRSIPGVKDIHGEGTVLFVTVQPEELDEYALRDLIALHERYGVSMGQLKVFLNPSNEIWFKSNREAYWYKKVFE